jgi:hypothetical protein
MEYPMICFNGGRPEPDGTYSARTKHGMISVIIHEVGHNFFPMIINSDERQWTWMDEGLNTFVQFLTEKEFDRDYPARRGSARNIREYMGGDKTRISPIMTNSESIYVQGVQPPLGLQAPVAGRLLPHHGGRLWGGPRLVLARLVLHNRPRGHRHGGHQVDADGFAGSRRGSGLPSGGRRA